MAHYSHSSSHSPCSACLYEHGVDTRVVVMGSSGVGKTRLLRCYTQHQSESRCSSTAAPSFVTKKVRVGETKVRLQLWDTPGRPSFRTMAPMYYRDADAALLAYNSADLSTCDELRAWLEEFRKNAPDLLIYIVGIKTEIHGPNPITTEVVRRLVRSWFPPTRQTLAPPPSPATKKSGFSSYFRFPFRSLSWSSTSLPIYQDESSMASSSPPSRNASISAAASPFSLTTTSIAGRNGAKYKTFVEMRRTQSELPKGSSSSSISQSLSSMSSKSLHSSRSFSSLRSLHSSSPLGHLTVEDDDPDESNSLPNKVEFFECTLQDKLGVNNLFEHLLQSIVHNVYGEVSADSSSEYNSSRDPTPSPPVTPTFSPRIPSYLAREKQIHDSPSYSPLLGFASG